MSDLRIQGVVTEFIADWSQYEAAMKMARRRIQEDATGISDSLNNALSPAKIRNATERLAGNLGTVSRGSKVAGDSFKSLGVDLGELAGKIGVSEKQFAKLQGRMLETKFRAEQERAWASIQKGIGASNLEMAAMRARMGDVSGAASSLGNIFRSTFGGLGPLLVGALSIGAVVGFGKEVLATGLKVEAMGRAFSYIYGGADASRAMLMQLRGVAGQLGQEFYSSVDAFKSFAAATKGTSLEGQGALSVYRSLSEASVVLGMSQEQTSNAMRALGQMMSKGNVQAEELRGQLGEALPGAFQMAAKAMGVTEQELNKMLEQGQVLAADMIPKLAKAMHDQFGEAAREAGDTAQGAINRATTAWEDLKNAFYNSDAIKAGAKVLTDAMDAVTNAMTNGEVYTRKYMQSLGDLTYKNYEFAKSKIAADKAALNPEDADYVFKLVSLQNAEKELEKIRVGVLTAARTRHAGGDLIDTAKAAADFKAASTAYERADSESAKKHLDIWKDFYEARQKAAQKYATNPEEFAKAEESALKLAYDRQHTLQEQEGRKGVAAASKAGREVAQAEVEAYRSAMEAQKAQLATLEGEPYWQARRELIEREAAHELATRKKSGESAALVEAEKNAKLAALDNERLAEALEWWDKYLLGQEKAHKAELDAWEKDNKEAMDAVAAVDADFYNLLKESSDGYFARDKANLDAWLADFKEKVKGRGFEAEKVARAEAVYQDALQQSFIKSARAGDDFVTGMQAGYLELERDAKHWGEVGADAVKAISDITADFFGDVLNDISKTGESFQDMLNNLKRYATRVLGQMAEQMIFRPIFQPVLMGLAGGMGLGGGSAAYAQGAGYGGSYGVAAGQAGGGGGFGLSNLSGLSNLMPSSWMGNVGSFMSAPLWGSSWAGEAAFSPLADTFGISAGPSLGGLFAAGGLASLGYSTLGGLIGLPQSPYSGITSGLGGAGGFALGNLLLPGIGGILGAILGGAGGGILGGLFGGGSKEKEFQDVYAYLKMGGASSVSAGHAVYDQSYAYPYLTMLDYGEGQNESISAADSKELAERITEHMNAYFKGIDDTFRISMRDIMSHHIGDANADRINVIMGEGEGGMEELFRQLEESALKAYMDDIKDAISTSDRGWIVDLMGRGNWEAIGNDWVGAYKLREWMEKVEKVVPQLLEFGGWIADWNARMGMSTADFGSFLGDAMVRTAAAPHFGKVPAEQEAAIRGQAAGFMETYGSVFGFDPEIDKLRRASEEQFDSMIQALKSAGADQTMIDALTAAKGEYVQMIVDQVKGEFQDGLELRRMALAGHQDEIALKNLEKQQLQERIATQKQFGETSQEVADLVALQGEELAAARAELERQRGNYNAGLDMRGAAAGRTAGYGEANALQAYGLQQQDELHAAIQRYGADSEEVAKLQAILNVEMENFVEAQERNHAATLRNLEVRRLEALGLTDQAEMLTFVAGLEEELWQARARGAGEDEIAAIKAAHAAKAFDLLNQRMDEAADRALDLQQRMAALTTDMGDDLDAALAAFDKAAADQIRAAIKAGDDVAFLDRILYGERLQLIRDFHDQQAEEENRYQQQIADIRNRAQEEWSGFATNIRAYLEGLQVREGPHTSPESRLAAAREQFAQYYALAQTGDRDAMGRITQLADTLLRSGQDYYGSTSGYQAIYGEVTSMLEALPDQISVEELMLEEMRKIEANTAATASGVDDVEGSYLDGQAAWITALGSLQDSWLTAWDKNADKQMTSAEWLYGIRTMTKENYEAFAALFGASAVGLTPEQLFAKLDANSDGIITATEVNTAVTSGLGATADSALTVQQTLDARSYEQWRELNGLNQYLGGNQDSLVKTQNYMAWNSGSPAHLAVAGLRSLVDVMGGRSFADGGYHGGGWRQVGERGREWEFTGPSYIHPSPTLPVLPMPVLAPIPVRGGDDGKEVIKRQDRMIGLMVKQLETAREDAVELRNKVDDLTAKIDKMAAEQSTSNQLARANRRG